MSCASLPPSSFPLGDVGVDISSSFDGVFYGFVVATVLFGITIVQGWIYLNSNEDKWPLRSLVASLILMDLGTTILIAQGIHHYLVANFGNMTNLGTMALALEVELGVTIVITFSVEVFFASRVLKLNPKSYVAPILIVLTAMGGLGIGIASLVALKHNDTFASLTTHSEKIEAALDGAFPALSDIIATVALSISFFKSRTGVKRTDSVLQTLFRFIVTRGVLVSASQVATLVLCVIDAEKLYWIPFHLCQSKLYVITMVAMLNARPNLRERMGTGIITDSSMLVAASAPGLSRSDGTRVFSTREISSGRNFGSTTELDEIKTHNFDGAGKGGVIITNDRLVSSETVV